MYVGVFQRIKIPLSGCFSVDNFSKSQAFEQSRRNSFRSDGRRARHKWLWGIGPPKSQKSLRRVALAPAVVELLEAMRD